MLTTPYYYSSSTTTTTTTTSSSTTTTTTTTTTTMFLQCVVIVTDVVHQVHRLSAHPTQPSSLISAVSYNNEVSVWDMETATRRQMLWASPATPFSPLTDTVSVGCE